MQVRTLSPLLGVELLGFDMAATCDAAAQAQLRSLFCQHHLLLIRGQRITEADQDRFTQYFGPLSLMRDGISAGHISNKAEVGNSKQELVVTGQKRLLWHSDGTYGIHPGIGTSLLAIDVAPDATPTMYINAIRALQTLSPALRCRIEGLKAVHYRETYTEQTSKRMREEDLPKDHTPGRFPSYAQPIVYALPHADQQALFVNELATSHIVDLPRDEGEGLLQELFAHLYADENVYTHRWQVNDLLIWDNLALQHCRPSDLGTATRHLRRLSLDGWNTGHGIMDWFASGTVRDKTAV